MAHLRELFVCLFLDCPNCSCRLGSQTSRTEAELPGAWDSRLGVTDRLWVSLYIQYSFSEGALDSHISPARLS